MIKTKWASCVKYIRPELNLTFFLIVETQPRDYTHDEGRKVALFAAVYIYSWNVMAPTTPLPEPPPKNDQHQWVPNPKWRNRYF